MNGKRTPPVMTHEEMVTKWMSDPVFKAGYDNIAKESELPDEIPAARKSAGLTQAQIAERMGTKATAATRMESNPAAGKNSLSFSTLKKITGAAGEKLQIGLCEKSKKIRTSPEMACGFFLKLK